MQVGEVDRNAVAGNYVSLKLNIRDAAYTHVTTNLVITIYVMNVFWSAFESRNKILDGSSPYAVETLHLRRLKSIKNNIIRMNQKNEQRLDSQHRQTESRTASGANANRHICHSLTLALSSKPSVGHKVRAVWIPVAFRVVGVFVHLKAL